MRGADRMRAAAGRPAVDEPQPRIEPAVGGAVPAPDVGGPVRPRQRLEELVAPEPVGVCEIETSLRASETSEPGTASAGERAERRSQRTSERASRLGVRRTLTRAGWPVCDRLFQRSDR